MPRGLLIFALCLPLAILLGFMLADPLSGSNIMVVGGAFFALLIPIILTVHHRALFWFASAAINVYFLPGQPQLWMVIALLSFCISILSRPLTKMRAKPAWDKLVLISLIIVAASILLTALKSGGVGMRVLGSAVFGGRKYAAMLLAIIGFVALTINVAQQRTAQRDTSIYILAPITTAFSNFAYMLGPAFYFMFYLFPVELAVGQAQADLDPALVSVKRYSGFGPASMAICMFCLLRWGIRGLMQLDKPWRMALFSSALFIGMLSGFRSSLALTLLVAGVQFFAAGLHRTKYLFGVAASSFVFILFLFLFSESLPLSAQRAISFLPVRVDPIAAMDAQASLQWRLEMWRALIKEIPDHLWLGKGYAIDPTDLYLAQESSRRGFISDYEMSIKAGDYHSGPLSVLISFGIVGVLAFIFFVTVSIRCLYRNMRYGSSELRNINIFLFSYFVARLIFFIIAFGSIDSDLWQFISLVGVGLSVNGGPQGPKQIAPTAAKRERAEAAVPALAPA